MSDAITFAQRMRLYAKVYPEGTKIRVTMTPDELEAVATLSEMVDEYRDLIERQRLSTKNIHRLERLAFVAVIAGTTISIVVSQILFWMAS